MSAKITTTYLSEKHDGNGILQLEFTSQLPARLVLEMEVSGTDNCSDVVWELYSENMQVDLGDLTRGCKAQLIMLKSYAGSYEQPHIFIIRCRTVDGQILTNLMISVYAKSEIAEAHWVDSNGNKIYEASINRNFTANFKGFGLYNVPLRLDFYLLGNSGEDIQLPEMSRRIQLTTEEDLKTFYIDKKTLYDHKIFFLKNTPKIIMDVMLDASKIAVTGDIREAVLAKAYFTITSGEIILFHGKRQKALLDITFSMQTLIPEQKTEGISPVVIYNEEYFTQKYEPCKYEKIFFQNGSAPEVEVFDEKKPTQKNADGTFKNSKLSVGAIVPPKGSKNIKELIIRLESVETGQCSFLDENKSQTIYSEESDKKEAKPHKGRVIDTAEVEAAGMEVIPNALDEKITIKPSFNYLYDKDSAWEFLKNYFLFSTTLDSKDSIQNELKGILIGWEAETKGIIDVHRIGLETCRYQKGLYLKTFADVAWAFHFFFDDPLKKRQYIEKDDEEVKTREGLDEKISWIQDNNQRLSVLMPLDPLGFNDSIADFVLEMIKDMASKYEFGFTAYYDFNDKKKYDKKIEYAEQYPNVFDGMIAGAVTVEILLQILLMILTEGASASLLLARLSKLGKLSGKMAKMGKLAEKNIVAIRSAKTVSIAAKGMTTVLKAASFSYYKGYRFAEDKNIGIEPLLEERLAFDPLFGIEHEHKKNLGDLVYGMTPVSKALDLTQQGLQFLTIGFNRQLVRPFVSKESHETTGLYDHYLNLVADSIGKVNEYLSFITSKMIEEIFGMKAEYSLTIKGGYGLDFELKIHNAQKKLNLIDFLVEEKNVKDASVAIAGSNKELKVEMKIDANVKVPVKAMNIINYMGKINVKDIQAEGKFEITSGIFIEKRYYFHASEKKPYRQDSVIFTGIAGEYGYKAKIESKPKGGKGNLPNIKVNQSPKNFVLIPPQVITHKPIPVFENPAKK